MSNKIMMNKWITETHTVLDRETKKNKLDSNGNEVRVENDMLLSKFIRLVADMKNENLTRTFNDLLSKVEFREYEKGNKPGGGKKLEELQKNLEELKSDLKITKNSITQDALKKEITKIEDKILKLKK